MQKIQLFPLPHWLSASHGQGMLSFLPSIHLAAKSKIMAGAFSPNLGKKFLAKMLVFVEQMGILKTGGLLTPNYLPQQ
ncbi:MAG: hypothetical protein V7K55_16260 [Nostoc sp.]|uniref:hypothetical protein n=1 Tax=Nostoc sp. TaxID=1180 RepID=UPI002FFA2A41